MRVPGSLLRRGMPQSWTQFEKGLSFALHTTIVWATNQPELLKPTPQTGYGSPFDKGVLLFSRPELGADLDVTPYAPYNVFAEQMDRCGVSH